MSDWTKYLQDELSDFISNATDKDIKSILVESQFEVYNNIDFEIVPYFSSFVDSELMYYPSSQLGFAFTFDDPSIIECDTTRCSAANNNDAEYSLAA